MSEKDEHRDDYIKAKLQVELEVDTSVFASGYRKGFVEGFKEGSQVEKSPGTELCFITKVISEGKTIKYEYCEVIKNEREEGAG